MTLDEATSRIKACVEQMDAHYGKKVFDEWAIISLISNKARILAYAGPRNDVFLKNFADDLGVLRKDLLDSQKYSVGDFEFARHGLGTRFEAFMVLREGTYLICNNTKQSMEAIAKDPRWLGAQKSFVELSDEVRVNPLKVSSYETRFWKKNP